MARNSEPDVLFSRLLIAGVSDMLKEWRKFNETPVRHERPDDGNPSVADHATRNRATQNKGDGPKKPS
jgi:hypothetical protein